MPDPEKECGSFIEWRMGLHPDPQQRPSRYRHRNREEQSPGAGLELYPDREEFYEMVYESRFQRLWEQFREIMKAQEEPGTNSTTAPEEATPADRLSRSAGV